ncbi:MAG: hypothetical protein JW940_02620 [Polyangiaceae bacterium]|nr:hypothetical protein [Polyangiaceae bacterium]
MVTRPVPFRLDEEMFARLDRITETMSAKAAGAHVSRSSVLRAALERGMAALEAELGLAQRKRKR